jgi:outer membrane lipoprotein-sorting protein
MKTFRQNLIYCFASVCLLPLAALAADPAPSSAAELAAKLSAMRQDGTSSVRLKMESPSGSFQLQTKERRTSGGVDVVYQVLWPKERKGEAVLLRKSGGRAATGAVFTPPDAVKTITASQMDDGLFGSALTYADILENFFAWGSQTSVGTEPVGRVECQIIESKPAKGQSSIYSSVRSWIDTRRMVPLRVEKYGASGKVLCRIDTTNVEKDDLERHLPASMTIRRAGGSVTTIQGTRIRHGVTLTERDFSPEGLADLTAPRS